MLDLHAVPGGCRAAVADERGAGAPWLIRFDVGGAHRDDAPLKLSYTRLRARFEHACMGRANCLGLEHSHLLRTRQVAQRED
eukprot:scaffold42457_cov68-Phaeocystis_antarctica.AAC.4